MFDDRYFGGKFSNRDGLYMMVVVVLRYPAFAFSCRDGWGGWERNVVPLCLAHCLGICLGIHKILGEPFLNSPTTYHFKTAG